MGSRVTRAVFREQRTTAIPIQQKETVRTLISYFILFILAFSAFLYGYMLGPHHTDSSSLLGLSPLVGLYLLPNYLVRSAIASSSLLLIATIILPVLLRGTFHTIAPALITASVSTSAVLGLQTLSGSFLQTQLLWFMAETFFVGVQLALWVVKQRQSMERAGFVDFLFSLVGLMSVFLVSTGIRALKNRHRQHEETTYTAAGRFIQISMSLTVIAGSFLIRQSSEGSLTNRTVSSTTVLITVLSLKQGQLLRHLWKIAGILWVSLAAFIIASQNQPSAMHLTSFWLHTVTGLTLFDSLHRLCRLLLSVPSGSFMLVGFYLLAYFICSSKPLSTASPLLYLFVAAMHAAVSVYPTSKILAYQEVAV